MSSEDEYFAAQEQWKEFVAKVQNAASFWDALASSDAIQAASHKNCHDAEELMDKATHSVAKMQACHKLQAEIIEIARPYFQNLISV